MQKYGKEEDADTTQTPAQEQTAEQATATDAQTIEELAAQYGIPIVDKGELPEPMVDTSDWQTYRNEEFGFEVRYPYSTGPVNTEAGRDEKGVWFYEVTKGKDNFTFVSFSNTPHDFVAGLMIFPKLNDIEAVENELGDGKEVTRIERYKKDNDLVYKVVRRNPSLDYDGYSYVYSYRGNTIGFRGNERDSVSYAIFRSLDFFK